MKPAKSREYRNGYSAGYAAHAKAQRLKRPQPDWVLAVTDLAERLGREVFAGVCRDIATAHAQKLASNAAKQAPVINETDLLTEMKSTLEPILRRIELQ